MRESTRLVVGVTAVGLGAAAAWYIWKQRGAPPRAQPLVTAAPFGIPIHVLFGSQTGTAEMFAKDLAEEASVELALHVAQDFPKSLESVADYDGFFQREDTEGKKVVVFVLSTYGEGDPSDDAVAFDNYLKQKIDSSDDSSEPPLGHIRFAIFGCGNRQYALFNEMAKRTQRNLLKLGATCICPIGLGDDNADIESDFREWKKSELWNPLVTAIGLNYEEVLRNAMLANHHRNPLDKCVLDLIMADRRSKLKFDACVQSSGGDVLSKFFFACNQVPVVQITHLCDGKVQVDIDISKVPSLRYRSGDTLEILPLNRDEDVDWLMDVYDLRGMQDHLISFVKKPTCSQLTVKKPFPTPGNLRKAISSFIDLHGGPSWALIRDLAILTGKSATDAETFANEMKNDKSRPGEVLTVIKFLRDIIGAGGLRQISLGDLIQILPKQKARAYSIASSPLEDAKKISIIISRVDDDALASTYLSDRLKVNDLIQVSLRQGSFRLPALPGTPVVMIGVGTGVAPFRAFLVELGLKNRAPTGTLFFGCRRESEWICRSEMELFTNNGGAVHVAFSRSDMHKKQYVQDLVVEHCDVVRQLVVEKRAIVYVCGSTKMGLSVMDAFNKHICSVDDLRSQKRYFEELWG